MEMQIRRANERGHYDHGWLDTSHTFSFADYYDPDFMGFRVLRVINEDKVAPGRGFGRHPHRDMEIVTYVLDGELAHRDSMGNGSVIRPGEVQRMTAGTGVTHSEMNASGTKRVHFMQMWVMPDKQGLAPSYEQKAFPEAERRGALRVVASPDGRGGSVTIHQDVTLSVAALGAGQRVEHALAADRYVWLQITRGAIEIDGHVLEHGDGAAIRGERVIGVVGKSADAEVLVWDLP